MLQVGELQIYAGYKSASPALNGKALLVKTKNGATLFDYVIDATDTPSEITQIDSPLIHNLVQAGLIRQHEFGGVEMNTLTHELENVKGMFILGHLTKGKLFYVSAIERLLVHAQIISRQLLAYHY